MAIAILTDQKFLTPPYRKDVINSQCCAGAFDEKLEKCEFLVLEKK
jgi:hypothetical protein